MTAPTASVAEIRALLAALRAAPDADAALSVFLARWAPQLGWAYAEAWAISSSRAATPGVWRPAAEPYLRCAAQIDLRPAGERSELPPQNCLPGIAAATREPVWSRDLEADPRCTRAASALTLGLRSGFAVPVLAADEVAAVLVCFFGEVRAEDPSQIAWAGLAADALGAFYLRERLVQNLGISDRQFRTVAEAARDAIITVDAEARIIFWNRGAAAMYGYTAEEILGKPLSILIPERLRAKHMRVLQSAPGAKGWDIEGRVVEVSGVRKDGVEFPLEFTVSSWTLDGTHYSTGIVRDISERRKMEGQLALSSRMASVGTLASGVAHEINNPLAYVAGNLEYTALELGQVLRRLTGAGQGRVSPEIALEVQSRLVEAQTAISEARQGAERVRNVVRDLKTFSRPDDARRGPISVRGVIDASINMAWNEIRHRARLVKDLKPVPNVEANESRLGQVLLNLLINAAQACPEGQADRNEIRVSTYTDPAGRVVIQVSDTGVGIPPEILGRIFDPFFTTKPVGIGTGLGLSICHGIVETLQGEITAESILHKGSTFRVSLPPARAAAELGTATTPSAVPRLHRGKVLVIDDDPLILNSLRRILGAEHDLRIASRAAEALEALQSTRFDVVLCDLMMPEMSGMDLHARLLASAPEVAADLIFLTGGAFTAQAEEFLERIPNLRIEKPFNLQNLRGLVRERCARKAAVAAGPSGPAAGS